MALDNYMWRNVLYESGKGVLYGDRRGLLYGKDFVGDAVACCIIIAAYCNHRGVRLA